MLPSAVPDARSRDISSPRDAEGSSFSPRRDCTHWGARLRGRCNDSAHRNRGARRRFSGLLGFVFLSWRPAIAPLSARTQQASRLSPSARRGSGRSRTLCVVSYPAGTTIRRWIRSKHAVASVVVKTMMAGQAKLAVLNGRTSPDAPQRIDRRPTRICTIFYRLIRDQCELAQVVIIERALSVGGLI
jgi:hypothetical protein